MIAPYQEPTLLSEYRDRLRGRKVLRFVDLAPCKNQRSKKIANPI